MPAGFMDLGETIQETACRELREETGWECTLLGVVCVTDNPRRSKDGREVVVTVLVGRATRQTGPGDNESIEQEWFSPDTLPKPMAFDYEKVIEHYRQHGFVPLTHLFLS